MEEAQRIENEFVKILHIPIPEEFKQEKWLRIIDACLEVFSLAAASTNLQPRDEAQLLNALNERVLNASYKLAKQGFLGKKDLPELLALWDFLYSCLVIRIASAREGFERRMQVSTYHIEQQITEQRMPITRVEQSRGVLGFMKKIFLGGEKE